MTAPGTPELLLQTATEKPPLLIMPLPPLREIVTELNRYPEGFAPVWKGAASQ